MGKRTAAEANVDDGCSMEDTTTTTTTTTTSERLESPVPLAWQQCGGLEPATRVRPIPKHIKMPLHDDDSPATKQPPTDRDAEGEEEQEEDGDLDLVPALASSARPPPLIMPRPRRVVSPELLFQYEPPMAATFSDLAQRRSFRPIAAGRPDIEITSPPSRAANPVAMDVRFQRMQRLDLASDASVATLQPFHRPCPQRRMTAKPVVLTGMMNST